MELRRLYHCDNDDKYFRSHVFYELISVGTYTFSETNTFDKQRFFDAFRAKNISIDKMRDFYMLLFQKYKFQQTTISDEKTPN